MCHFKEKALCQMGVLLNTLIILVVKCHVTKSSRYKINDTRKTLKIKGNTFYFLSEAWLVNKLSTEVFLFD